MNGSVSVKQADVVLDTFPLNYQNNYTQAQKLEDLDYVCTFPMFSSISLLCLSLRFLSFLL